MDIKEEIVLLERKLELLKQIDQLTDKLSQPVYPQYPQYPSWPTGPFYGPTTTSCVSVS